MQNSLLPTLVGKRLFVFIYRYTFFRNTSGIRH